MTPFSQYDGKSSGANLHPVDAFEGLFCLLPQWDKLANVDSIVHQQPHLNPGFAGHPTIIVELSGDGRFAKCLQSTSFSKVVTLPNGTNQKGSKTIMEKFPHDDILRSQHLPVRSNEDSIAHDKLPLLELKNGAKMNAQSFVKLDFYFEIETSLLLRWSNNRYALTTDSLCRLMYYFNAFISGNTPRRSWSPGSPKSPIDFCTPLILNKANYAKAHMGYQLEAMRFQHVPAAAAYNTSQQYQTQPLYNFGVGHAHSHWPNSVVPGMQTYEVVNQGGYYYDQYACMNAVQSNGIDEQHLYRSYM